MHEGWEREDLKVIYSGKMPDVAAWFDIKEVFPLKKLNFEGLEFPVPHNPEHYLGSIYSFNFMELPPEEKRTIHAHAIKIVG
jgi:lipopolysaccharide cholinephosphotransferase